MEEGQSGGPRSQVPGDETTAYTGTSGKAGFAPSKCLNLLLLAHGPWRCNPLLPPNTHIPHLKWTCHLLSPSPAHLLSCLTVPARKPIWSSDTLRALSPHHAPGPRQPLQALGVHKLVRALGRTGWWAGEEQLQVTHLDPPASWHPGLALLSLWSLKNQEAHDRGYPGRNTRSCRRGLLSRSGAPVGLGPAPPPLRPQHLNLQMGPSAPAWKPRGSAGFGT